MAIGRATSQLPYNIKRWQTGLTTSYKGLIRLIGRATSLVLAAGKPQTAAGKDELGFSQHVLIFYPELLFIIDYFIISSMA